eukprot:CAMPEP_0114325172 /NCGR_PEP_ID=MMETSP0059-20121206/28947_1 /TAXON_ID=36894 /ORGANISM="Pyramimonas parkeae, Strain CCMP726" /LENGTH=101 /DNA_ID=CAMNT_0001453857 /DNA_START=152 /DNA_END=457 /DNA_ORIENTATION=+
MMDEDGIGGSGLREDQLVTLDEMDAVIRQSIESTLGTAGFQPSKINAWTSNIVEGCLKRLAALEKPFKYVGMYSTRQGISEFQFDLSDWFGFISLFMRKIS